MNNLERREELVIVLEISIASGLEQLVLPPYFIHYKGSRGREKLGVCSMSSRTHFSRLPAQFPFYSMEWG